MRSFWQSLSQPIFSAIKNRELLWRLLVRDIQSMVRGSVLGMAWIVLIPLVLVAIYSFVFGIVLKSAWTTETSSTIEVPLIYFTGLMTFAFFMEIVTRSPDYLRSNKTFITKIIFPVDILNWVLVGSAGFKFLVSFTLLSIFLVVSNSGHPSSILLVPIIVLPLVVLCLGLSWIISALGAYVRDFNHILIALAPVLMFMSPIFYSVEQVPPEFHTFYWINPLTFILESLRGALFFGVPIDWSTYTVYSAASIAVFYAGFAFFQRVRPGFADVM